MTSLNRIYKSTNNISIKKLNNIFLFFTFNSKIILHTEDKIKNPNIRPRTIKPVDDVVKNIARVRSSDKTLNLKEPVLTTPTKLNAKSEHKTEAKTEAGGCTTVCLTMKHYFLMMISS